MEKQYTLLHWSGLSVTWDIFYCTLFLALILTDCGCTKLLFVAIHKTRSVSQLLVVLTGWSVVVELSTVITSSSIGHITPCTFSIVMIIVISLMVCILCGTFSRDDFRLTLFWHDSFCGTPYSGLTCKGYEGFGTA